MKSLVAASPRGLPEAAPRPRAWRGWKAAPGSTRSEQTTHFPLGPTTRSFPYLHPMREDLWGETLTPLRVGERGDSWRERPAPTSTGAAPSPGAGDILQGRDPGPGRAACGGSLDLAAPAGNLGRMPPRNASFRRRIKQEISCEGLLAGLALGHCSGVGFQRSVSNQQWKMGYF